MQLMSYYLKKVLIKMIRSHRPTPRLRKKKGRQRKTSRFSANRQSNLFSPALGACNSAEIFRCNVQVLFLFDFFPRMFQEHFLRVSAMSNYSVADLWSLVHMCVRVSGEKKKTEITSGKYHATPCLQQKSLMRKHTKSTFTPPCRKRFYALYTLFAMPVPAHCSALWSTWSAGIVCGVLELTEVPGILCSIDLIHIIGWSTSIHKTG